jgi:flavodoxin
MDTIVVFDSVHGNTERVARVIGEALAPLGDVQVLRTTDVPLHAAADAWVVGGPTHNHGLSKPLSALLKTMDGSGRLQGVPVATFDTRYHYPRLMSGSAAHSAAGKLRRTGCHLITGPMSFFVEEGPPPPNGGKPLPETEHLADGELDRARAWGTELAGLLARG